MHGDSRVLSGFVVAARCHRSRLCVSTSRPAVRSRFALSLFGQRGQQTASTRDTAPVTQAICAMASRNVCAPPEGTCAG